MPEILGESEVIYVQIRRYDRKARKALESVNFTMKNQKYDRIVKVVEAALKKNVKVT